MLTEIEICIIRLFSDVVFPVRTTEDFSGNIYHRRSRFACNEWNVTPVTPIKA